MPVRSPASAYMPPAGQAEDLRQRLYALERRRWREGFARFKAGGRLIMRVEPTYRPSGREAAS